MSTLLQFIGCGIMYLTLCDDLRNIVKFNCDDEVSTILLSCCRLGRFQKLKTLAAQRRVRAACCSRSCQAPSERVTLLLFSFTAGGLCERGKKRWQAGSDNKPLRQEEVLKKLLSSPTCSPNTQPASLVAECGGSALFLRVSVIGP